MSCYLIPIGGTGVRVMKAVMQMCAAGCFTNIDFKVMCIDSDNTNGDIRELESLFKSYVKLPDGLFNKVKLVNVKGNETGVWSPLSDDEGKKDKRSAMKDMVRESLMSKNAKKVLEVLYTEAEREKILEGGFYGHTSIGSYFMAQEVVKNGVYTDVWEEFFSGIGETDKIFIIGSVFGGTGASGVPTIARLIKENSVTKDVPLGAIFVMPYFKPQRKDDELSELPIDWTTFSTKTKTALAFYQEQQFENIFDTMYFIGDDPDDFMSVEYHEFGTNQANKPNPVEVFAATSVLDFMMSAKNEEMKTKFLTREEKIASDGSIYYPLTQKMLNEIGGDRGNCFENMSKFLKFSILYVKYLFPCIRQNYSAEGWLNYYKKINLEDAENLHKVCAKYLLWIKRLTLNNKFDGKLDENDENSNLNWFKYKGYEDLYQEKELTGEESGWLKKHLRYDLDALKDISGIVKEQTGKEASTMIEYLVNDSSCRMSKSREVSDLKRLMIDIMGQC